MRGSCTSRSCLLCSYIPLVPPLANQLLPLCAWAWGGGGLQFLPGQRGGDLCPSSLTFSRRLLAGALCWLRLVCIFCLPHHVRGRGEDTDVSSAIFTSPCFSISLATKTACICKKLKAVSFWKATLKVSKGDFINFLSFGGVFLMH